MIKDNLLKIRQRISFACAKAGRDPDEVTLVAVSKGRGIPEIEESAAAGITDIGENKVQEALVKYNDMRYAICDMRIRWHLVGHLQSNKAKDAVKIFDLIHSVDSLGLAQEIDKQAGRISKVQDILVEIKTSAEETKFGLRPEEAQGIIEEISRLKHINIKGLMTIAPLAKDPEKSRPYFRMLRELRDGINAAGDKRYAISELSMGMSDDFEVAVEEGATMLRIGRAIFESGM